MYRGSWGGPWQLGCGSWSVSLSLLGVGKSQEAMPKAEKMPGNTCRKYK